MLIKSKVVAAAAVLSLAGGAGDAGSSAGERGHSAVRRELHRGL